MTLNIKNEAVHELVEPDHVQYFAALGDEQNRPVTMSAATFLESSIVASRCSTRATTSFTRVFAARSD